MNLMSEHQNSTKDNDRYYAIDAEWIQKWLNFVEGKNYHTNRREEHTPPGPITNGNIEVWLAAQSGIGDVNEDRYFLVNKNLFYFFRMVYGGGPALVNTKRYHLHEVHEDPKVIKKPSSGDGPRQESDNDSQQSQA